MSEWISVKDRLPFHGQFVLASGKDRMEVVWCDFHQNNYGSIDYVFMSSLINKQITGITHWMPLPSLPEDCK